MTLTKDIVTIVHDVEGRSLDCGKCLPLPDPHTLTEMPELSSLLWDTSHWSGSTAHFILQRVGPRGEDTRGPCCRYAELLWQNVGSDRRRPERAVGLDVVSDRGRRQNDGTPEDHSRCEVAHCIFLMLPLELILPRWYCEL